MLRPIALAALLACAAATAAQAETSDFQTNVAYGDLNLSHSADVKILTARLESAAASVCLKANRNFSIAHEQVFAVQYCIAMAVNHAMSAVQHKTASVPVNLASSAQ
jgi:UrcA family protein